LQVDHTTAERGRNVEIPRRGRQDVPQKEGTPATGDALYFAGVAGELIDAAASASWYSEPGNAADVAVATLCRLRRAAAGVGGRPEAGDDAVRAVLETADPAALVWFASRLVSYADEMAFADLVPLPVPD
jgi:hypothetical protein